MKEKEITTLGELKKSGYQTQSIQQELAKKLETKTSKRRTNF